MKAALILMFLGVSTARAGTCPSRTVAEEGGTHWCYSAGALGHVHLWKPGSYDRARAVTIVYVHGYNLGDDGCSNAHYIDCAWKKHHLATQFAKSGLNALFVAVEGPVNDEQRAAWKLDPLLDSVRRKGGIRPPLPVVAMGHSGGIFTVERFLDDDRLRHVIMLDAGYQLAPKKIAAWYGGGTRRRLTLIGASGTYWTTGALGKKLGCDGKAPSTARCAMTIDEKIDHMRLIREARVMPHALTRIRQPSTPKPKPRRSHRRR